MDREDELRQGRAPLQVFRRANVEAAVWERRSQDGRVYHEVSVSRSYRRADGTWGRSAAFGMGEVAAMLRCTAEAERWALAREHQLGRRSDDPGPDRLTSPRGPVDDPDRRSRTRGRPR